MNGKSYRKEGVAIAVISAIHLFRALYMFSELAAVNFALSFPSFCNN